MTPHPCSVDGQTRCENGTACGDGDARSQGFCDKSGCDFNSYRMGDLTFYGAGDTVDTTKPFTIVTQFITADGTNTGTLSEIKRFYVQGGKTIPNSMSNIAGVDPTNSITEDFCDQQKTAFNDTNDFKAKGGLAKMGAQLEKMVLVLSVWDDTAVSMNWLDSTYPPTASGPGAVRGTCDPAAGLPATVESAHPDASVIYSNIKIGAINSTFTA